MKRIYLNARMKAASLSDATQACILAGRLLLGLIAVLLPAMIWTERLSTFDKFFQGGQDCEMSILALFAFLCLVILLSQRGKQSVDILLIVHRLLARAARHLSVNTAVVFCACKYAVWPESSLLPSLGISASPLRI